MSITASLIGYKDAIEAALSHADYSHSFDDIVRGVLTGQLHFYPSGNDFAIMEIQQYPRFNAYHCFLAGGTTDALLELQEIITQNAKALNCDRLTFTGRRGFLRRLKDSGWEEQAVHMTYPIG
ncbi:hypothetical protein [Shimia aestuarii]|uniref:Uncharacterized protein n=1 Tax=Shimia aestuarii TaxID=254406 RepID=A0A1I4HT40_9RHOB|nr:hypothetical protein [Shimia aestuarii]SFL44576.1 hypothetical protein SAMN04488042_101227 [Shimia aestuarii]